MSWVLGDSVVNFSQSIIDDTLKSNINFQGKAGIQPRIIRKAESKCCKWCSRLEGEYRYPDIPKEVYRRHERCRCTIEYAPYGGKKQNVHSKMWTLEQENVKVDSRKVIGLKVNGVTIKEVGDHVFKRMSERSLDISSVIETIERPLQIQPTKYDDKNRPSFIVVGQKATLSINPETGKITTTYPTHTKTALKLFDKGGN